MQRSVSHHQPCRTWVDDLPLRGQWRGWAPPATSTDSIVLRTYFIPSSAKVLMTEPTCRGAYVRTVVLAAFPASLAGAALHCTAPAPQSVLAGPRRLVLLALVCAGKQGAPAAWCGLWWSLPADPNPWLALHEV